MRHTVLFALFLGLSFSTLCQAADGVTDTQVTLGVSRDLQTRDSDYGAQLHSGARAFFKRINASGGIHGRKIEFIDRNDDYEPEKTAKNLPVLVNESKVFGLFGFIGSPTCKAAIPFLQQNPVPFLFPYSGAEFLRQPVMKNVFTGRASYGEESEGLVRFAIQKLKLKDIAVFYQDDAYGVSGRSGIDKALAAYNLRTQASGSYKRNTIEVDKALDDIMKARPQVVVLYSVKRAAQTFIEKAAKKGFKPVYLAPSPVAALELADTLGKEADNIYASDILPLPSDTSYELVRQYQKDMKASGHAKFNPLSLEGYFDATVLAEALKRAGRDLTREKLEAALEGMKNVDVGGIEVTYSPENHQALHQIFLSKIEHGKISALK